MARQIYVNLPIADVARTRTFFADLGFSYEPKFSDEKALCMIVAPDSIFVMMLQTEFFGSFIDKKVADAKDTCEVLLAFSCESREEVDRMLEVALQGGGREPRPVMDYGFMYNRAFEDLDGHVWEVVWMNPDAEMPSA